MTACVNCARALQPAWKYCIFCGTRTAVAAAAPRSRPLPNPAAGTSVVTGGSRRASAPARTSVPAFSGSGTPPIVPVAAPAPLAAAPNVPPVSSEWPETLGERPSLRSALAATDVPAPTPPSAPVPAPEDEDELEIDGSVPEIEAPRLSIADLAPEPAAEEPAPRRPRGPRRRPGKAAAAVVEDTTVAEPTVAEPTESPIDESPVEETPAVEDVPVKTPAKKSRAAKAPVEAPVEVRAEAPEEEPAAKAPAKKRIKLVVDEEPEPDLDSELDPELENTGTRADRVGRVNILAVLALLLGVLASPLAALFGHVALGQLRASGERGVIPAWIAIVLGYLWLGFFLVLGITYLATNG